MGKHKRAVIVVPRFKGSNGFYTTKSRSELMSKIRAKNTTPELIMRKALWNLGIRYRKDYAKLPGKPDIVSNKYMFVVFVDGEFWHGYNWEEKRKRIKSNRDFWIPKIERNMQRDKENNLVLNKMGYKVFRFWGREVTKELDRCIKKITSYLEKKFNY